MENSMKLKMVQKNISITIKKFIIAIAIITTISIIMINTSFFYKAIFNIYCESTDNCIEDVDTFGLENVSLFYRFLFTKGQNHNDVLEQFFFDQTAAKISFHGIPMKKGDVAWFLYGDINGPIVCEKIYTQFGFSYGAQVFRATMRDNELRKEIFECYKSHG